MNKSLYIKELEDKIRILETRVKHLTNDLRLTKEENENSTGSYFELYSHMERNVVERKKELIGLGRVLEQQNRELEIIMDSSPEIIFFKDTKQRLIRVNRKFARAVGGPIHRIIGKKYDELFYGNRDQNHKKDLKIIKSGNPLLNQIETIETIKGERKIRIDRIPQKDINNKVIGIIGFAQDITEFVKAKEENRKLEAHLQHAQKMEAISTLAGGISHDFNNLLTAILGYNELSQDYAESGTQLYDHLAEAQKACMLAKGLIKQFIAFTKSGVPEKKTGSVRKLIRDATNLRLCGSNIKCEFSLSDDLWYAEFDETQMKDVIANLIANAIEAMRDGGIIKVSAKNVTNEGGEKGPRIPFQDGKYLKISIQDQGIGIPEEDLPKLYDPYFSTKERGIQKGMGLGLSIVYSVIKNHDGYIDIESEIGKGTTFNIYLPAFEKQVFEEKVMEVESVSDKWKILLMDDEVMVREVTGKMLSRMGHRVEFAEEGAQAVEMYKKARESAAPFDAVILDLTIRGGMGGKEAIRKLIEIDSGVKGIVSSGYSGDPTLTDFKKCGFRGAVGKPYKIDELSRVLQKVIEDDRKNY